MKKLLGMFGILFTAIVLSYAGTPQETFYMGQPPLFNTTIYASTWTSTNPNTTIASPTCSNTGGGTYVGRVCLTKRNCPVKHGCCVLCVGCRDNGSVRSRFCAGWIFNCHRSKYHLYSRRSFGSAVFYGWEYGIAPSFWRHAGR